MGDFFDEHFIATYQDKGDFRVDESKYVDLKAAAVKYQENLERLPVKDRALYESLIQALEIVDSRKEGGNVVSYFCTTDGRVIHMLTGPVQAPTLLREATWAVQAYDAALETARDDPERLAIAMRDAHQLRLSETSAADEYISDQRLESIATRTAHEFLAKRQLPLLNDIQREVFEKLAKETFHADGGECAAVSSTPIAAAKLPTWTRPSADEEAAASRQLTLAKNLRAANPDAAARRLNDIINEFPRTKAAEEARGMVDLAD